MKLEHADAALADHVKQIVAMQMAEKLQTSRVDLADDQAVAAILSKNQFGSQSIAHLMGKAAFIARGFDLSTALAVCLGGGASNSASVDFGTGGDLSARNSKHGRGLT